MEKLATLLRQTRESRRLSLKDVAAATRIPLSYLLVLEGEGEGDGGLLADQAYLVPFLRTYTNFLGMDTNAAVMQFLSELQPSVRATAVTEHPVRTAPVPSAPSRLSFWAIPFLLFLGLLFVGSFLWQNGVTGIDALWPTSATKQELASKREPTSPVTPPEGVTGTEFPTESAPAPSPSGTSAPTSLPSANPTPSAELPRSDSQTATSVAAQTGPAAVTPPQSVPAGDVASHRLNIQANSPTWVRIVVDDQPPKEMILKSGESRDWSAQRGFTLSFGNAGGVTLNFDGQTLPPVGKAGQVVRNIRLPAPEPTASSSMQ